MLGAVGGQWCLSPSRLTLVPERCASVLITTSTTLFADVGSYCDDRSNAVMNEPPGSPDGP